MKSYVFIVLLLVNSLSAQSSFSEKLTAAALELTKQEVTYDPTYFSIPYPNGDVPEGIGVCTDVVIRAYRAMGTDLQQLIHEDMKKFKSEYDKIRKTEKLDPSIDHRRTQNQQTFLRRQGAQLSITNKSEDYKPGDLVFYDVAYGHVGIVTHKLVPYTDRYYIVHNIGRGNEVEDFLFGATIVGHYRWEPK